MMNACFLEEGELLKNAGRIAHIPTYIVHGRYDMICIPATACDLAARLNNVELRLTRAGHSWTEPANTAGVMRGLEWVAGRIEEQLRTKEKENGKEKDKERDVKSLRVAAAQIPVTRDVDKNLAVILRAIDGAVAAGAEILLTPEGSLSGYTPEFDREKVKKALAKVVQKASDGGLALALGTCLFEPDDGRCYNQIRFYDRSGEFLGFHSKILRCGSLTEPPRGEIDDYAARELSTFEVNGIRVGGLICNDMWGNPACTPMPEPHLSQQLSRLGAKIVFHAINGGRNGSEWSENVHWPFHESNMRLRAQAGGLWIVSADNCAPQDIPCSAPSGVLGPDGRWKARAPRQGEHVVVFTIRNL
jgi:predicted amidohydrolase